MTASTTVRISSLANGLRVVTDPIDHVRTAAVGVWVECGARHETQRTNGVSHMLEHMAFKGTGRRTARRIAEEIEAVGGYLNAYTSRDQTAYYARVMAEDLDLGLDILADILRDSVFDPTELERERGVILQEIGQALDTPDDLIFDRLQEACWADQPMGWPILGPADNVRAFSRDDLRGYMTRHYGAGAMILAASGAVDHDALVARAEALFGDLPARAPVAPAPARWTGGDRREVDDLEQAHWALALEGVSYRDPDYFAMQVMSTALGGGMSSRLFQEVREIRGLCYSVFSFATATADAGSLGVYAGTSGEDVDELARVVCGEMAALAANASEEEVARGRAQLKASLAMGLESTSGRCEQIARQLALLGEIPSIESIIAAVEAVDAAAVRRVAERLLARGRPAMAALGPVAGLGEYDGFARRFGAGAAA